MSNPDGLIELWTKARNGDKISENKLFSNLYARYLQITKHIIWKVYRIKSEVEKDCEDIVSDTMEALLKKLKDETFVLNKGLLQYTNVILRNIIYKYINEKAKDKLIESIPIDCESDSETISDSYICVDPETEDLLQYIKAVITKLSKNCQIIFLAFLQGYELNDVLNDFFPNTPRGTFDNMVWRCRKSLKIELKKEGCLDGLYKS